MRSRTASIAPTAPELIRVVEPDAVTRKTGAPPPPRMKRATAVSLYMRSVMGDAAAESLSLSDGKNIADLTGMRKPVVVEFMERAIASIMEKSGYSERENAAAGRSTPMPKAAGDGSDSDHSDGSEVYEPENASEKAHLPTMDSIQSMRDTLMQGANIAQLAGLLTTSTFSLKDKRIDSLIGAEVPVKSREILMLELMKAIDALWERFGTLLLQQFGSFEKAFEVLDGDRSGFVDRDEFSHAYVDMYLKAESQAMTRQTTPPDEDKAASSPSNASAGTISRADRKHSTLKDLRDFSRKEDRSSKVKRRSEYSGSTVRGTHKLDLAQMNKTILKADAEFLFDMLRTGEKGLANSEDSDDDLTVSMRTIIMRLTGLGEKTMESFRERIIGKYWSIQAAFDEVTRYKKQSELDYSDFERMFCDLYLKADGDENPNSTKRRSKILPAGLPATFTEDFSNPKRTIESEASGGEKALKERATRIFNGIDIDGSGLLTVTELQRALAAFGSPTTFSTFRRRLLLQYGSYDAFYSKQPVGGWKSEELVESFAMELDLTISDANNFASKLGLLNLEDQNQTDTRLELPADGYSLEEFAISVFLNKPEEATIEDLIAKLGTMDRDKDIPFREFTERIVNVAQQSMHFSLFQAVAGARAKDTMVKRLEANKNESKTKGSAKNSPRARSHSIAVVPVALPVTCRVSEVKCVYEALQREHRRVTVNILLRALTNFSDVLALDRSSYQSGDHIVCRVRLSTDALKRCKELPFVAVVPERLEWKDLGAKSYWCLDGERVSDIVQVCERVHQMPRAPNGSVLREACLKISVPFVLASEERYEVRLFSSNNGHDALKQVGRSVPFDLMMPSPHAPLVDQISLNASSGEASVVLHWSPPVGNFVESPIKNFIVLVEPLIYRHERVAEVEDVVAAEDESQSETENDDDDDEDMGGSGMKEVVVWSPSLKGFTKKLSYGVDGLQRGVQYRFGVQCVHAGPGQNGGEGRCEIRGAPSELCDVVTMPLYNVTEAPGQPQVSRRADGMIELVWAAPADEGLSDSNRICNYLIQYRQCSLEFLPRQRQSTTRGSLGQGGGGSATDDDSDVDESEHSDDFSEEHGQEQGWVDIDESKVFISQPRWADFVGWLVPSHIEHLQPIDGESDHLPHEFRVCASNYAGNSQWSRASIPLQLTTAEEKGILMPVIALELVEVQGLSEPGRRGMHRSHCLLRWAAPPSSDMPRYTVQVRDSTQVRGEGGWVSAKCYFQRVEATGASRALANADRRRSSDRRNHLVEAIVTGLDRFPSFANLSLQVRATSSSGTSTAEVQCPGIDLEPPEALQEPPQAVQVLMSANSPPIVELQWPEVEREKDYEPKVCYAVQASRAPLAPSGKGDGPKTEQKWSEWFNVMDVCFSAESDLGGGVTCFARDLGLEGLYVFRICIVGQDGQLSPPSPPSDPPIEVSQKQAATSRRSTLPKSAKQPESKDTTPRKPIHVKVIRTERGWCEICWEQRLAPAGMMPTDFQVEECQDDHQDEAVEPTWVPARAVYASLEDSKRLDHGSTFNVKAAVFFADDRLQDGMVPSRWRVRVRTEDSEWSVPTQWHEPPPPPLPPRPSAPQILGIEHQYFTLQWKVPEGAIAGRAVHYELQMQGHQQRHGGYTGKYSDWVSVPVYTKLEIDPDGSESEESAPRNSVLQALVQRRDVVEISRGSDAVCFRVRVACANGVTGQPSHGSDLVPIHESLPLAPVPQGLAIVGKGRIVMESQIGTMVDAECVRVQWFLPSPEEDPAGFKDASLPGLVYEVEAKDAENGFWVPMAGAMIELNHTTRNASALIALPPSMGHVQQTRIRVASARGKGAPTSHSTASPPIMWGAPVELEDTPRIVRAEPSVLVVRYTLPQVAARPESCSVIALVETQKRQLVRFQVEDDTSNFGEDFGDSDGSSAEDSPEGRYSRLGEFVVYSQLAKTRQQRRSAGEETADAAADSIQLAAADTLQLQQSCLGFGCEGTILVGAENRLSVGDEVRISLRIMMAGVVTTIGDWSRCSVPAMVKEPSGPPRALPLLEYPAWDPVLKSGEEVEIAAKVSLGVRSEAGQAMAWADAALKSADGKNRFNFEVVNGTLPEGLLLDCDTGVISGISHPHHVMSCFTIRAEATTTWPGRNGGIIESGSSASVTLETTMLDNSIYDSFSVLMQDSVVEELQEKEVEIADVLNALKNIKLLPACARLHLASEGDAGDSAILLVERLLQLPSDAIVVAAELDEEDFVSRLFGDDIASSSEEGLEDGSQHLSADHSSASGTPQSRMSGSQSSASGSDLTDTAKEKESGNESRQSSRGSDENRGSELVELPNGMGRRKSNVSELPMMGRQSSVAQASLSRFINGEDASSRCSSSMSNASQRRSVMGRRHSLATTSLSGFSRASSALQGANSTPSGATLATERKSQSRRVSLAVQAKDIKMMKLADAAQGIGLSAENFRKADSKAVSRRASEQSNLTYDSNESDAEGPSSKRAHDKAGHSEHGAMSRAGSAGSSSASGSVSEEMAKQLNEIGTLPPVAKRSSGSISLPLPMAPRKLSHRGSHSRSSNTAAAIHAAANRHMGRLSEKGRTEFPSSASKTPEDSMKVTLTYPSLTPLWPAFTDVEFVPSIRCCSRLLSSSQSNKRSTLPSDQSQSDDGLTPLGPGLLRFEIQPPLPAKVVLDEVTGVISGSPLMEHVAGRQYTITARWEVSDQVAAHCAVAFGVVSAALANLCNAAFLGQEPPAFRPTTSGLPPTTAANAASTAATENVEGGPDAHPGGSEQFRSGEDTDQRRPSVNAEAPDLPASLRTTAMGTQSHPGSAIQDPSILKMTPAIPFIAGMELQALSIPRKPGTSGSPWRSKLAAQLPPTSASRKNVLPLGPPLRDREPLPIVSVATPGDTQGRAPLSARPRMRALYNTATQSDAASLDDLDWPSTAGSVRIALGISRQGKNAGREFFGSSRVSSARSFSMPKPGSVEDAARTNGLTHGSLASARSRLTSSEFSHDLPGL